MSRETSFSSRSVSSVDVHIASLVIHRICITQLNLILIAILMSAAVILGISLVRFCGLVKCIPGEVYKNLLLSCPNRDDVVVSEASVEKPLQNRQGILSKRLCAARVGNLQFIRFPISYKTTH